jgi:hypothetical protein
MAMARSRMDRIFGNPRNASQRQIDAHAERDDEYLVQRTSSPPSQPRLEADQMAQQLVADQLKGSFNPSGPTAA